MKNILVEDTPKKQQVSKPNKKNRKYEYKKGSTVVLFFPRLTEYQKYLDKAMNTFIIKGQLDNAANVIVWIAKQNRYSIIKGYVNQYQLDIIEVAVEDNYIRYKKNHWLDMYKPFNVIDFSHVPPSANYISDIT